MEVVEELVAMHESCCCQVKLDGRLSDSFSLERGLKQGLVMDPLLRQLQVSGVGLSINLYYHGCECDAPITVSLNSWDPFLLPCK